MNRRKFLKFSFYSVGACLIAPRADMPSTQGIDLIPNTLGVMKCSGEFMRLAFDGFDKDTIQKALSRYNFPEDTKVIEVWQEKKDIPFEIWRIMISQKDLPRICEGCEIPIVTAQLYVSDDQVSSFEGWTMDGCDAL